MLQSGRQKKINGEKIEMKIKEANQIKIQLNCARNNFNFIHGIYDFHSINDFAFRKVLFFFAFLSTAGRFNPRH